MKQTIKSLLAIAVIVFAFSACSDVPAPYTIPSGGEGGGGETTEETIGTLESPLTIDQALAEFEKLAEGGKTTLDAIVIGKVSRNITSASSFEDYHNINYYISVDGTQNGKEIEVYRGMGLNNEVFSAVTDIKQGDEVIVRGKLFKYKNKNTGAVIPEIESGYLLKYTPAGGGGTTEETLGTLESPLSIDQALAEIENLAEGGKTTLDAIVIGKVSRNATSAENFSKYKNINYYISVDGTQNGKEIEVYKGMGLNNKVFSAVTDIKQGDEVIVRGKLFKYKNNNTGAVIPEIESGYLLKHTSASGGGSESGSSEVTPGTPQGDGTQASPFNVAAAVAKCKETGTTATADNYYVKGIVKATATVGHYKDVTFDMVDSEGSTEKFTAYQVKGTDGKDLKDGYVVPKGAEVIVYGKLVNYNGDTPEIAKGSGNIVSVNGKSTEEAGNDSGGEQGGGGSGETASSLTNGDFEQWANGLPTGWKSASTASSATLSQSTDAHGGSYSCCVAGDASQNKRLASQEITLAAGTYEFAFYAKATTADKAQVRPGQVPVADGKVGSYAYGDYATISNTAWTKVTHEFTLSAETTVCLVVMNPKASSYSSGKDVLIDDATLTKK